ncbi:MAG: exonuclease domain-containing protein [[Eubacterium] saphenum]|nr:exonuclease domain-containing protein [[Eubacterium] saphenum]
MNFIILDLEWNQALNNAMIVRSPVVLYGEIIQIGAVKTDENFNLLDKIKINVRPKFYKKMNPYVEKITGITREDLACGETFPQEFRRFAEWCGEEYRIITWGFDDIGILCDNLRAHGMDAVFGRDYINLQLIFNRQTAAEHLQCALSAAAEKLEIPIDVQVHDALNDAYLTYEVLKKLDMVKGVAEYAEMSSTAAAVPIVKDYIEKVDGDNMIRDRRLSAVNCPFCEEKMSVREWFFSNRRSCKTLAECKEHGVFLVKLKAARITDDNYTVIRSIFTANDEDISSYERKVQKRKESLERRKLEKKKKAEGKDEEKHDNV